MKKLRNNDKIIVKMTNFLQEYERSWLTSTLATLLLIYGIYLLTWNEGRAVKQAYSLDEAMNQVISVNPYEHAKYDELDGQLIHVIGPLLIDEPLTEPDYDISVQAVKLKRRVQMYQWVEERNPREDDNIDNTMGITDYYYVTEWRDKLIDSTNFYIRFGHENPTEIPLKSIVYIAPKVRIGFITINDEIKVKFDDFIEMTSDVRPERKDVKLHMGIYYHCEDVWNPQIGDIRVQFYYAGMNEEIVTAVGLFENGVLKSYKTSKGHQLALLRYGNLNINQIFDVEHMELRYETWKMRLFGLIIIYASVVILSRLIRIILSYVPVLNGILTADVTSSSENFIIALSITLLIISFGWIFYRPIFGLSIMMAAISPTLYCLFNIYT